MQPFNNDGVALRVERNCGNRVPIARVARPACRTAFPRRGVQRMTRGQNRVIATGMALRGADVANATVAMVEVVPPHEGSGPSSSRLRFGEALLRELGAVLGGAEQRFDKGIVVADARARIGRLRNGLRLYDVIFRTLDECNQLVTFGLLDLERVQRGMNVLDECRPIGFTEPHAFMGRLHVSSGVVHRTACTRAQEINQELS
jgi:hypothetical protein